jgi:large subunit ribosomal protein L2
MTCNFKKLYKFKNKKKDIILAKPDKKLLITFLSKNGRNNKGHIVCRHKGGGHKKRYRIIDFKRDKIGIPAKVINISYDPYRTALIALVKYIDGETRYILHPEMLKVGDIVCSGENVSLTIGNHLPLEKIPLGTYIHNISIIPNSIGKLVRAAGESAQIIARNDRYSTIRLPSKELRLIINSSYATIGTISSYKKFTKKYKAGQNRWLGIRPTVRGVAMNACDHPHGGGEGRSRIGCKHPRTPWGKPALGYKTRKKRNKNNIFILN